MCITSIKLREINGYVYKVNEHTNIIKYLKTIDRNIIIIIVDTFEDI